MNTVTQAEFARLAGVNRSTVNRWLKNGRIEADAAGRIDPEAAARLRLATESPEPHHQARKAQFEDAREAAGEPTPDEDSLEGLGALGVALKRATLDLQRRKAELAALEVDQQAGRLVDRSDIDFVLGDLGATLRSLAEGIPDRLAGEIAAHQGNVGAIHKALEDAMRELLLAVSAQMQQRMEALTP